MSIFQLQELFLYSPHGCGRCRLLFHIREVGAYGSSGDSNVFKNSTFGKLLESNKLDIPDARVLPSDAEGLSMPFVLVGDEAFTLSEHVLRPYPNKKLTFLKHIYTGCPRLRESVP